MTLGGAGAYLKHRTTNVPYDLSSYDTRFNYSWPAPPSITNTYIVSNSSELSVANVEGSRIILRAYDYGNVTPANNQEWIIGNGALIDTFTFTGRQRISVKGETARSGRIGRVTSDETGTADVLFNEVNITSHLGSTGDIWSSPNGQRVAIVNSSLQSQSYVIFPVTANENLSNNLIIAGNYIYTSSSVPAGAVYGNQHGIRAMSINTFLIVGNYIEKDDDGQALRIHTNEDPAPDSYDGFIAGNTIAIRSGPTFAQGMVIQPASAAYTPNYLRRIYVENNEIHNGSGGCIALQEENSSYYDSCEFNNNNAYGSLGLPGDLSSYNSTQSGNTESSYNAGSIPSALSVLGWSP